MKRQRAIEADTGIMVDVVADTVVNEAVRLLDQDLPGEYVEELTLHAESVYLHSDSFRKRIRSGANRGNAGRDWLYAFMRHWLASLIRKQSEEAFRRLPREWVGGGDPPGTWRAAAKRRAVPKRRSSPARKRRPSTTVQSLIFDSAQFTIRQAKSWAKKHGFKASAPDVTAKSIRLRQMEPDLFKRSSFRTITLTDGIKAVVGRPR